jgi:hypothetical protein
VKALGGGLSEKTHFLVGFHAQADLCHFRHARKARQGIPIHGTAGVCCAGKCVVL